jgi:hypothetical protein
MTEEIWKEIDGFPDYKISTMGRVMSFRIYRDGKLLSTKSPKDGYKCVSLCSSDKNKCILVHRLVALTFLPNYYNLPTVDHKDRNRQNNSIYNLRWFSHHDQNTNTSFYRTDILETDPKKRKLIINKQTQQRAVEAKKFYCNTCNKAFQSNRDLVRHYTSKKHITTKST